MPHTTRIPLLDLIRTAALLGMAAFHFSYDLLMFGLIPYDYSQTPFFYFHARTVAATFLILAGIGLWLAHQNGIRWVSFWRRFGKILAAAFLVSLATRFAMPEYYVFFGILHAIAFYSLLGLATLRLPAAITIAMAATFITGSYYWQSETFNAPLLRFIGLGIDPAQTVDFEPIFPWFGAFLIGIAIGRIGTKTDLWTKLTNRPNGNWVKILSWPGQHSLPIYLIHQPILMALVWAYAQLI